MSDGGVWTSGNLIIGATIECLNDLVDEDFPCITSFWNYTPKNEVTLLSDSCQNDSLVHFQRLRIENFDGSVRFCSSTF